MPSSYSLYIDEAGDEGFNWENPRGNNSSEWFIVSGIVVITANRSLVDDIVMAACDKFGKSPQKNLHWRNLKLAEKEYYSKLIGDSDQVKGINICIYKPEIDPLTFGGERLYFYFSRYLIERTSWLVRDAFQVHEEKIPGDGTFEIVFSKRKNMNYSNFEEYMSRLRTNHSTSIEWRHVGRV